MEHGNYNNSSRLGTIINHVRIPFNDRFADDFVNDGMCQGISRNAPHDGLNGIRESFA
jgi:hypothetical protein